MAGDKIQNRDDVTRVLDIKEACEDKGTEICSYGCNGQKNQQFYFEYL